MPDSSQKFIGRNRPPRVQIEYDVELYGSEKKVQIPFVMGVLADLAGKPGSDEKVTPIDDRSFLDIDMGNFNDRLKAMKPHVAFDVPSVFGGEANFKVDLTFESMDDFSPAAVAGKVDGVKQFLEARTQLDNLLTYMDGKSGAEEVITKLINDESLMKALTSAPKPGEEDVDESSNEKKSDGEG